MLTFHCEGQTNIVEICVDGKITREDFDRVAALIESVIAVHGKVRLIEIVREFGSMEPAALWADLKFGPRHLKDFSHVAVVGHARWLSWLTSMAKPFMSAQVKYFDLQDLDKARAWIHNAQEAAA